MRPCWPDRTIRTGVRSTPSLSSPMRRIRSSADSPTRNEPAGSPQTPGCSGSSHARRTAKICVGSAGLRIRRAMVLLLGFMSERSVFSSSYLLTRPTVCPIFSLAAGISGEPPSRHCARGSSRGSPRGYRPQASEPIPKVGSRGPAPAIPEETLHGSSLIACGIFFHSPRSPPSFLPSIQPSDIPRTEVIFQFAPRGTRISLTGVPPPGCPCRKAACPTPGWLERFDFRRRPG